LTVATMLTSLLLVVGQTLLVNATIPTQKAIAQVTSVTQISDISDAKPTGFYFQSLQSLVERYGCVTGSHNKTIQPTRGLQAAEFIGFLNSCMDRMTEIGAASTADIPGAESLGKMQKLLREIEADVNSIQR